MTTNKVFKTKRRVRVPSIKIPVFFAHWSERDRHPKYNKHPFVKTEFAYQDFTRLMNF